MLRRIYCERHFAFAVSAKRHFGGDTARRLGVAVICARNHSNGDSHVRDSQCLDGSSGERHHRRNCRRRGDWTRSNVCRANLWSIHEPCPFSCTSRRFRAPAKPLDLRARPCGRRVRRSVRLSMRARIRMLFLTFCDRYCVAFGSSLPPCINGFVSQGSKTKCNPEAMIQRVGAGAFLVKKFLSDLKSERGPLPCPAPWRGRSPYPIPKHSRARARRKPTASRVGVWKTFASRSPFGLMEITH